MENSTDAQGAEQTETLYAWCVPAWFNGSVLDHTWVTSYDNRTVQHQSINDVKGAGDFYWYSWGSFHPKGGVPGRPDGFIVSSGASLSLARCLCDPNVESKTHQGARGTIFSYGIDGVCHQLANQILWATTAVNPQAKTVNGVRGYWLSNAAYGTYGLQHAAWKAKKARCQQNQSSTSSALAMANDPDDFETHAIETLRGHATAEQIADLLGHRQQFTTRLALNLRQATSAQELNEQLNRFFARAVEILGPENFERVFGTPADANFDLVDPKIFEESQKNPNP
ncbi:hypothetical protein [Cupriavidus sp. RAF12]|uniref:hypothetical protein n=1 Tax=Cupriavidus sp. RAF12 TaxID=3233050 RepID=UPI003F90BE54